MKKSHFFFIKFIVILVIVSCMSLLLEGETVNTTNLWTEVRSTTNIIIISAISVYIIAGCRRRNR